MPQKNSTSMYELENLLFALEASGLGLWEADIQSGKGFVDKQWAEMLGYRRDEVEETVEFWHELIHPDDKERVNQDLDAYLTGKVDSYSSEYRLRTKEGNWKWIHAQGKIVRWDAEGKPLKLVGTHKDIQERKEFQEALIQEKNKLEAVISALGDGLTVQNTNFEIIYQNAMQIQRQGQHKGEYCYSAYHNRNEVCQGCLVQKCFEDGKVHRRETSATSADGKEIFMEVSASPLRDSQGNIMAAVETVRDITKRKLLEVQLHQAQKLEAIGTLAGGIAHDFNNILTAIYGYAELVQLQLAKDSSVYELQTEVIKASNRARDLVRQILVFSRQEARELRPLTPAVIIKEAIKMLRASIPTTIEIRENIDLEAGTVLADPTQIHQVLVNLCTNAYHAMRENGGILTVSLKRVDIPIDDHKVNNLNIPPGAYVCLTVSDTGKGMDPQTVKRIFDPYFTTKKKGEGTGLGLAVVHGIISSYGGSINVDSEPRIGTSFNIYIPRINEEPFHENPMDSAGALPKGTERILIVDDEQVIVGLVKHVLGELGYQVISTTSSLEAMQVFSTSPDDFDLVITDMNMPAMNGAQLAKKILAVRPDLPILLCTGFSDQIDKEKAVSLGINKLLMKPIGRKELACTVRMALDERF